MQKLANSLSGQPLHNNKRDREDMDIGDKEDYIKMKMWQRFKQVRLDRWREYDNRHAKMPAGQHHDFSIMALKGKIPMIKM